MPRRKQQNPFEAVELVEAELGPANDLWSRLSGGLTVHIEDQHITQLEMPNSDLTEIPAEVFAFFQLRHLSLRNNRIASVSDRISALTALQTIDLSRNRLTSLPAAIQSLHSLTTMHLRTNHLISLPPEMCNLVGLRHLCLNNNRLHDPYPELAQSTDAKNVLAYLKSISVPSEAMCLREARLILVGNGKVGKTQLKNALLDLPFEEGAATTHGIEIDRHQQLSMTCGAGGDLSLTIWDFGGQDTYEVTHQFFYGRRSIYLLVWHPRATSADLGVEAWLSKLQLRLGQEARVIIVATHKDTDRRHPDLDLNGLRQKYGKMVVAFYEVENKSRDESTNGIAQLKREIAEVANSLSQMDMIVHRDWLAVRNDLAAISETTPQISYARYLEVAQEHSLDQTVADVWLRLLHDLGDLLHYGDTRGLKDHIVLRPDWLTGAIARVLDDTDIVKNRGVLEHKRLPQLWNDYDEDLHPFLHSVMEQFDICCREAGQGWSLVGEKVPHDKPTGIPQLSPNPLRIVYEFDNEPPGLLPWLIVRTYRFTTQKHWRLGAYLCHDGHQAVLSFNRSNRRLTLSVHGPVPVFLFSLLQDGVEQVLPRWAGLQKKVRRLVPCGQKRKSGGLCDRFFDLGDLKDAAGNGEQLQCNGCRNMANVPRLLSGMGFAKESLTKEMSALLDEKMNLQFDNIRQLFNHTLRITMRAISDDTKDAPRLFSIWPKEPEETTLWERVASVREIGTQAYEIWLWCEHSGSPHPVKRYEMRMPSRWLQRIAPYAKLIATTLKVGLQVAGPGVGLWLSGIGASAADAKDISSRIDTMAKIAEKCLSGEVSVGRSRGKTAEGLAKPEGSALIDSCGSNAPILILTRYWDLAPKKDPRSCGGWAHKVGSSRAIYDSLVPQRPIESSIRCCSNWIGKTIGGICGRLPLRKAIICGYALSIFKNMIPALYQSNSCVWLQSYCFIFLRSNVTCAAAPNSRTKRASFESFPQSFKSRTRR